MSNIHVLREYMISCRDLAVYVAPPAMTEEEAEAALAAYSAAAEPSDCEEWEREECGGITSGEQQQVADAWAASLSDPAEYQRRVIYKFMSDFPAACRVHGGGDETHKFWADQMRGAA